MNNINNTIAIVTPTLNSEKYLEETILSVILQKGDFYIDYVIVDGLSADGTMVILEKYKKLLNENKIPIFCNGIKFTILREEDKSMYQAINKGFKIARGDVMTYINSDDRIMPGAFLATLSILKKFSDLNWLTGRPSYTNKDSFVDGVFDLTGFKKEYISKGYYRSDYLYFIQQEGTFWTRDLWEKSGAYMSEEYDYASDYEFWIRLSQYSSLYTVHAYLGTFRKHSEQISSKIRDTYFAEMEKIKPMNPNSLNMLHSYFYKKLTYHLKGRFKFGLPYVVYDKQRSSWSKHN